MGGSGVLRNWKLPFGIMSLGCYFFVYGVQTLLCAMVSPIYPIQRFYFGEEMALDGYRRLFFLLFSFFVFFVYWGFSGL